MKELLGGILMAVGILIAGASGLCSLVILFGSGELTGFSMLPLVALVGGIPMVAGVGIAYGGRALLRSARNDRDDPPPGRLPPTHDD